MPRRQTKTKAKSQKKPDQGAKTPAKSQLVATLNKPNNQQPSALRLAKPVSMVCSLTDPFCEHARAGKYFDINGGRSLSYPVRRMVTLATNASGELAVLLLPNYSCIFNQTPSALVSGVATFGNFSGTSSLLSSTSNYRLVSWGFRVMHMTTPLTASGYVAIRGFSSQSGASYQTVDCLTMNADVISTIPLQDCKEVAVIGKKANTTSAFYTTPATTYVVGALPATYVGCGWDCYTICVQGGPATSSVLTLELFQNYEVVIDDADATAQLMTLPPTSNEVVNRASAIITSSAKSVFEKGVEMASSHIKSMALKSLASFLGGPVAGRAVAMVVD